MAIGPRLRTERKAKGLSQEKLAQRADMSVRSINQLETGGIGDPHYSTLVAIADALGISVSDLIEEKARPKALAPPKTAKEEAEERRIEEASEMLEMSLEALEKALVESREALREIEAGNLGPVEERFEWSLGQLWNRVEAGDRSAQERLALFVSLLEQEDED